MLIRTSELEGYHLEARDGTIGKIKDFLFDDETWGVRYVVGDTGRWLPGRRVILSPSAAIAGALDRHKLPVNLTKEQVRRSPGIESDEPVSEQRQRDLHAYYGWPPYWGVGPYPMAGVLPPVGGMLPPEAVASDLEPPKQAGDPHLRSINHVTGYKVHASDGVLGHIDDFLLGLDQWTIRALIVDTRNWLQGKRVVVSPATVDRVSWTNSEVAVHLSRDAIRESPEYQPDQALDPAFERRLAEYDHGVTASH